MTHSSLTPREHRTERARRFAEIDLYPVTCERLSNGRSDLDVLCAVRDAGCRIIQLRDKTANTRRLYEKALQFRQLTREANMLLIINDRIDLALAVDADGVHLGQDDFPFRIARKLLPDKLIGASTHSLEEARDAIAQDVDYINIGPIFPTGTKDGLVHILGLDAIPPIAAEISIPFTVMGGINEEKIPSLKAVGARRIAVVTAVTRAPDMTVAARHLRHLINEPTV